MHLWPVKEVGNFVSCLQGKYVQIILYIWVVIDMKEIMFRLLTGLIIASIGLPITAGCGQKIQVSTRSRTGGTFYSSTCHYQLESTFSCQKGILISGLSGNYYSQLKIYDGQNSSFPVLPLINGAYRSSSNQVYISLTRNTYRYNQYPSFLFYHEIYNKDSFVFPNNQDCTEQPTRLIGTSTWSNILSPGFPNNYYSSRRCNWVISAADACNNVIKIDIKSFQSEKDFDFLRIYEGKNFSKTIITLSGNVGPKTIISKTPQVSLIFSTDSQNNARGFQLSYKQQVAFPIFTQKPSIWRDSKSLVITAHFLSAFPVQSVIWKLNDNFITTGNVVTIQNNSSCSELTIQPFLPEHIGTYKISLKNERGITEQIVFVRREYADIEILNTTIDRNPHNVGTIKVTFESHHGYLSIAWFHEGVPLLRDRFSTKQISSNTFQTSVWFSQEQIASYGSYLLSIKHAGGTTTREMLLTYPPSTFPSLPLNIKLHRDINSTEISAEFISDIPNPVARIIFNTSKSHFSSNMSVSLNGKYYTVLANISSPKNEINSFIIEIENAAGMSRFREKIHQPIASTYSQLRCTSGETLAMTCNLEDICNGKVIYWEHTINGKLIRKLRGTEFGNNFTLIIDSCDTVDTGTYTCIIESVDHNNKTYIYRERHFSEYAEGSLLPDQFILSGDGLPILSIESEGESNTTIVNLVAKVISNSPTQQIKWFKINTSNGENEERQIVKEITQENNNLNNASQSDYISNKIFDQDVILNGQMHFLLYNEMPSEKYGLYGVEVKNDIGVAIMYYELFDPREDIPLISPNSPSIMFNEESITIRVFFNSFPKCTDVIWFKNYTRLVQGERHCVQAHQVMEHVNLKENISLPYQYLAELNISSPTSSDYGEYVVKISNTKGSAQLVILLKDKMNAPPFIKDNSDIFKNATLSSIHVEFESEPPMTSVQWKINDKQVPGSQISSWMNGSIIMTDIENTTTYMEVKVSNDYGYFYESFNILEECPINTDD